MINVNKSVSSALHSAGISRFCDAYVHRCTGRQNIKGELFPLYGQAVRARAQAQKAPQAERLAGGAVQYAQAYKIWLDGCNIKLHGGQTPAGADLISLNGVYYRVKRIEDDYADSGWQCVTAYECPAPSPAPGAVPAYRAAVYDFFAAHIDNCPLYLAGQNGADTFGGGCMAIFGIDNSQTRGTVQSKFTGGREQHRLSITKRVHIAFFGQDACDKRDRFLLLFASSAGADFFNERGMGALYAEPSSEGFFRTENLHNLPCCGLNAYLGVDAQAELEQDYFDSVEITINKAIQ